MIEARDQERLLADPALTEPASAPDASLGALLLERFGAETVAAALARMVRARLPRAESDFAAAPQGPARQAYDSQREPQRGAAGSAWFRISIGRRKNADPKWLIPADLSPRRRH